MSAPESPQHYIRCPKCGSSDEVCTFERVVMFQRVKGYDHRSAEFEWGDLVVGYHGLVTDDGTTCISQAGRVMLWCGEPSCGAIWQFDQHVAGDFQTARFHPLYGRPMLDDEVMPETLG